MSSSNTVTPRSPKTDRPLRAKPAEREGTRPGRKSLAIPIGLLLVALGIVLSGTILESTILPEGTIVGTTRRATALGLCRILLTVAGVYFLIRRPRVTVVHVA